MINTYYFQNEVYILEKLSNQMLESVKQQNKNINVPINKFKKYLN